jgi:DNA-binding GntR family transcriptional regulator
MGNEKRAATLKKTPISAVGSARDMAYEILRSRIINLDLKPNDVLNDKELMEQMEMSRTPIREAIIMLSLENLVVVRPQSGTFIAPIDLDMVGMEQFSRYALEKEMAERACPIIRAEHKQKYKENIFLYDYYRLSQSPDRENRLRELDNDFHKIAFEINGKEAMFHWMINSMRHIERIRMLSIKMDLDTVIHHDHEYIAQAIIAGDVKTAQTCLERHMTRYQDNLGVMKNAYPYYFREE